ncbi:unnamed protein product [Aphanomyces euteiches]
MVNPLTRCLEDYALPPFAQLRVSDIVPAIRTAIREYALDLNAIEDDLSFFQDDITWESVMDRLEIIDDPLNRLWRIVVHLQGVSNSAELREAKARFLAFASSEETWHPDVQYYQIRATEEPGEPVIAQFYLDLYARPGEKRSGAWIEVVAGRSRVLRSEKAHVRLPVFALMFNYSPPVDDKPYLMTFVEVQSLFVMFGFGLRIGLTAAEHTAATRPHGIEWDAAGYSSQFMQNFCFHRETLQALSSHVETGEPLPDELFDRITKASTFMRASLFAHKFLEISAYDLALHHEFDPHSSADAMFDLFRRKSQEVTLRPPFHEDKYICALEHIFPGHYPSTYYSYVWSEMLAADAYACFADAKSEEEWTGLGRKFRYTMLALAGPNHPMEAFEKFRGRLPSTEGLLKQYGLE